MRLKDLDSERCVRYFHFVLLKGINVSIRTFETLHVCCCSTLCNVAVADAEI